MEDFKEKKTALGYVVENHIINKCGFFAFRYDMVAKYVEKESHTRGSKGIEHFLLWYGFFTC